jgi:hypothetical protein
MQDRYVGDIGDFAKYSLLRALSAGQRLGIAWYLFPDEGHNEDGKHISYLSAPEKWRSKDPGVFDAMKNLVKAKQRSVSAVVSSGALDLVASHSDLLFYSSASFHERQQFRLQWRDTMLAKLNNCDIIFADPDNGLCEDNKFKPYNRLCWKRLAIAEANLLAEGRTAVFYHHNSRRRGGHAMEINYWMGQLRGCSFAVRYRALSARTFFVVNAKEQHFHAARSWAARFGDKAEFVTLISNRG